MSSIVETGKVFDWLISRTFGASPRTHKTCVSLCCAQKDLREYTANRAPCVKTQFLEREITKGNYSCLQELET